jgi:tRNA(adenine34) deaminase
MTDILKDKTQDEIDEYFINECLKEAALAEEKDEVPIGAVIVKDNRIIARAHNLRESDKCATHHAEILAIEDACKTLGGWRLPGTTLYCTLEPCCMCAGAIINARVERVVFGANDLRFGGMGSLTDINAIGLNHRCEVRVGVMADKCKDTLSLYFKRKRVEKESIKKASAQSLTEK